MEKILDRECPGDGTCFKQCGINHYYSNFCQHKCKLIPCPNYIICGHKRPRWYLGCHGDHCCDCAVFCSSRRISYTFDIKESNEECPICYEIKKYSVKSLDCEHRFCSDCFQKYYFREEEK